MIYGVRLLNGLLSPTRSYSSFDVNCNIEFLKESEGFYRIKSAL